MHAYRHAGGRTNEAEATRRGRSAERVYFIHAGRTRPKLPAEVDWWDRTRAEYITITITIDWWDGPGRAEHIHKA